MSEPLLPPNATFLERALAYALDPDLPVALDDVWNPDRCPLELLPWLAHALSVDVWEPEWPEHIKRQVVRSSVLVHRRKGTRGAIRRALESLGHGDADVAENFSALKYGGTATYDGSETYAKPDHWAEYRVFLKRPVSLNQAAVIQAALTAVAPLRCHLAQLDFTEAAHLYDGTITYDGTFTYGAV